ncbi:MAG: putative quinol monooxygenase [Deltaproteobacteria bacterium]|nr:putative quinol monooxygenase [Deltaproteobacteria bacterium]
MLTIVAKMKIKAGKEGQAEQALSDMIGYVSANEPGTLRYSLHRAVGDPTTLLMYEQYADQAAVDTHGTSARIQQLFGTLGPLLDGQPGIEMYVEVAGKK